MDGDGISSGASSPATTDEVPLVDPELLQPNAWPVIGRPTEHNIAVLQQLAPLFGRRRLVRSRLQLGGPNAGRSSIWFLESTRDDGDEGGHHPRHGDTDDEEEEEELGFSFGAVPASGVAIACLPEITVAEGEAGERGECAVCLEEYEAGDALRTMPCAHGFHERCIFGWLSASRLCPLCRFALPAEEDTAAGGEAEVGRDERGEADDDGSDAEHMFITQRRS